MLLLDGGVQVVVPPLTALLTNATWQKFSNRRPVLGLLLGDELQDELIFSLGPRAFDKVRIEDFLPSVEALYVGPSSKRLSHFLPVLATLLLDGLGEHDVFCLGPVALAGAILVFGRPYFVPLVSHSLFNYSLKLLRKRYKMKLFLSRLTYLICISLVIVLLQSGLGLCLHDLVREAVAHVRLLRFHGEHGSGHYCITEGSRLLPEIIARDAASFAVCKCVCDGMRTFIDCCMVVLLVSFS